MVLLVEALVGPALDGVLHAVIRERRFVGRQVRQIRDVRPQVRLEQQVASLPRLLVENGKLPRQFADLTHVNQGAHPKEIRRVELPGDARAALSKNLFGLLAQTARGLPVRNHEGSNTLDQRHQGDRLRSIAPLRERFSRADEGLDTVPHLHACGGGV